MPEPSRTQKPHYNAFEMKMIIYLKKHMFGVVLSLFCLSLVFFAAPAMLSPQDIQAAPPVQIPIYTPTPGPDGRIIYIVKQGDSLISISIISGVSVEKLRELNNLTDDKILEGQELLLGLAGPGEIQITPGPTPTATPILPTTTPRSGSGTLCILLYNDLNGDSIRQEEEPSIPDGAISINNRSGSINLTETTLSGLEHFCFEEIPEGEYTIRVAIPAGFNPTTDTGYSLVLGAGDSTYVDFGAQTKSDDGLENIPEIAITGERKSPILAIAGAVFVLLGLGLALFAGKILKGK
jgi:LysM repeat protein